CQNCANPLGLVAVVYSRAEFNSTSALVERIVVAKGQETSVRAAHDLLRTREPPLAYASALRTPMTTFSTSPATLGLHAISALHAGLYCAFQPEAMPHASPMRA